MEKRKKYRHVLRLFATVCLPSGFVATFEYGASAPVFRGGAFITSDEKVAKELEAHKGFNKDFFLESVNGEYVSRDLSEAGNDRSVSELKKLTEELGVVTKERDVALAKCESLEQALKRKGVKVVGGGELDAVTKERDVALAKCEALEQILKNNGIDPDTGKSLNAADEPVSKASDVASDEAAENADSPEVADEQENKTEPIVVNSWKSAKIMLVNEHGQNADELKTKKLVEEKIAELGLNIKW